MSKRLIKGISLCLILMGIIGVVFTGCGNSGNDGKEQANQKEGNTDQGNAQADDELVDFSYPMEGNKTLTYWVALAGNVSPNYTNYGETPLYQEISRQTGVNVKFLHPAAGQEGEQFNIMLASGELPDIIEYNWGGYSGGPEKAIQDGHILELTEVFKKYAPNITAYFESRPDIDKMAKTDMGHYFVFPFTRPEDELVVSIGPVIRKDWLTDLGLEVPETIDEWYTALKAFKDEKGAKAPLTYEDWLFGASSAFVGAYGIKDGFYLEDDEIKFGSVEPGFKEFLQEYSKWYKEGLLDPDIATIDFKQATAKITGGESGAALATTASRMGTWLESMIEVDSKYELVGTPYPVLNKGDTPKFGHRDLPLMSLGAAAITTACEDVETAARFLDFGYSEQGHMVYNFGIEGESYEMVDGYPKYTDKVFNDPEGVPLAQSLARYVRAQDVGPFAQDKRYIEQYLRLPQQKDAINNWMQTDAAKYLLPTLTPTPEESQEFATIMNEINTYKGEMFLKFLFGDESLDNFDDYVNTINDMGLARAIEIQTEALKRYETR